MSAISLRLNHVLAVLLVFTSWPSQRHGTRSIMFVNAANTTIANSTVAKNTTTTNTTATTTVVQPSAIITTAKCYSTISQIILAEALVKDTNVPRQYVMCANTRNNVVKLDFYNQIEDGGQAMIPLRPNMHLKCGDGGQRDSNCVISDGDIMLDGTTQFGVTDTTLDGVVIEGFTFLAPGIYAAELAKPGRVLFRDCVFKVSLR
jgi:hypothetical protein